MNSKKKDFLISISIVFTITLSLILYANYILINLFGLNQENFMFIVLPLIFLGLLIFLSFANNILKPLFKSDDNLQKSLKETLHELNIPVSTIQMNTQMLQRKITDEKSLKRLERIKQASDNLLKLYENMEYDIKKEIDSIEIQEFYLDEVVNNSINKFDDIKRDIKITSTIPNIKISSDLNGFEKVIDNLVSNAIKYNIEKEGLVTISYEDNKLSIFNTGEKIDTKNLFIIFEKYYQENRTNDGFGLGLNMVKEFCDKNRITITIDTLENGNRFNLNLENIIKM